MKNFLSVFIKQLFAHQIKNRHELLAIIKHAGEHAIFDKDSLPLIEAVLQFGDMRAKNILLPRHKIDIIDINKGIEDIVALIIDTGHSRFPVVDGNINDIIGIFHAKDIVQYFHNKEIDLRSLLRPVFFIPELKPLDSLLFEMRIKHSHIAIAVDEFSNIAGMITLEMIIEQIVGDIDDEYDSCAEHILVELSSKHYRIKGYCDTSQLKLKTTIAWSDDRVTTVSGFITKTIGRIPVIGEVLVIGNCTITVINADSRKINTVEIQIY